MSTTITGNSANNPTSLTVPSDGDGPGIKAADVVPAFQGLLDKIAFLGAHTAFHLIDFQWASVSSNLISLVRGTTDSHSATMVTSGIAAVVGDLLEVDMSAFISMSLTGSNPESVQIFLRQNGNNMVGGFRDFRSDAASGSVENTSLSAKALFVVTTPGTVVISTTCLLNGDGIGGDGNVGDLFEINDYATTLKIWRTL